MGPCGHEPSIYRLRDTEIGVGATLHADGHTVHDFDRRFAAEDEGLIYPDDKVFRWSMLDDELNYRWF